MFNRNSTNPDIRKHDWAQRDRATLLRSLHAGASPHAPAEFLPGVVQDRTAGVDARARDVFVPPPSSRAHTDQS